jgi:uncharacterized protein with GYD domain
MKSQSLSLLVLSSIITIGLAMPAAAQQPSSTHRYVTFFKYTDQAIKAMADNPQDRTAAVAKLIEGGGGKLEALYFFPMGGEFDGMTIAQSANELAVERDVFITRSSGRFTRLQTVPIITGEEFKAVMERAKQGMATYAAPGR